MPFDFNTAEPNKDFSIIPAGTFAKVSMLIRPPEPALIGDDPLLKKSTSSDSQMLDCEFTILYGPYANRKIWSNMVLLGVTDGQKTAGNITKNTLRAILESARNVNTTDNSEAACKARFADLADFSGLEFAVKIGIDPAKNGYDAKNKIQAIVTPDQKNYVAIMSGQDTAAAPGAAQAATQATPAWQQPAAQPAQPAQQATPADNKPVWA